MKETKRVRQLQQWPLTDVFSLAVLDFLGLGCAFFLPKIDEFYTVYITKIVN
jgi:hypothetical protein